MLPARTRAAERSEAAEGVAGGSVRIGCEGAIQYGGTRVQRPFFFADRGQDFYGQCENVRLQTGSH